MKLECLEEKFNQLLDYVNTINNKELRESIEKILFDKKYDLMNRAGSPDRIENGIYYPGDHHFFKGGLLCHLLEVTRYAVKISEASCKVINKDLIISGACMHDIGKIITYEEWNNNKELKNPSTIYADKVQHSHLGIQIVSEYLDDDIDEKIKLEIYHIIASHMSKDNLTLKNGALVHPNTIEAKIVCEADRLSWLLSNYDNKENID